MLKHESFILILDGIDGAGKTAVAHEFLKHLQRQPLYKIYNKGVQCDPQIHSFPTYNTKVGRLIESELKKDSIDRKLISQLFAIDREIHTYKFIEHIKNDKGFYIFNRYYPANFSYNLELGLDTLKALERDSFVGDLVVILDVPAKLSFERRKDRRDSFEKDVEYLEIVRSNYLDLATKLGWYILDGNRSIDLIVNDLERIIFDEGNFPVEYR